MRALLVDDHLLFGQGLKYLLEDLDPALECDIVSSIASAVAKPGPYDFVLLDYSLPDSKGSTGLQRVLQAHEESTVIILSGDTRPCLVEELVELGASGFIPKSSDTPTLMKALGIMLAGGVYLPPRVGGVVATPALAEAVAGLSPRQMDCLLKLVQGKPNKTIARELDIAESTIKTHLAAAFKALGVNNRAEATFKASELGLLPTPARRATDSQFNRLEP